MEESRFEFVCDKQFLGCEIGNCSTHGQLVGRGMHQFGIGWTFRWSNHRWMGGILCCFSPSKSLVSLLHQLWHRCFRKVISYGYRKLVDGEVPEMYRFQCARVDPEIEPICNWLSQNITDLQGKNPIIAKRPCKSCRFLGRILAGSIINTIPLVWYSTVTSLNITRCGPGGLEAKFNQE